MSTVLIVLFALLGHGYVWVAIVNRLHGWAGPRYAIKRLTDLCMLCFLTLPLAVVWKWQELELGNISYGILDGPALKTYVQLCGMWGVLKLLHVLWGDNNCDPPDTLLSWQQEKSAFASNLGPETYVGAYPRFLSHLPYNQVLEITVDRKRLRIPRLQEAHQGIRLVHISDLHLTGRIASKFYEAVVEQVNALEPDVVFITGDIVEKESCLEWLPKTIGKLQAKCGVYFVLGNHDRYIDRQNTIELLESEGFQYLGQSWYETKWNGADVVLAGNELPWQKGAESLPPAPVRSEAGLPLRIGLLHTPDQFSWAVQQDVDLALAGHTHGGQMRLPILGAVACPSLYGTRFACGVFRKSSTVLHVTRGVSGKMPLRWKCPPEIALIELVR